MRQRKVITTTLGDLIVAATDAVNAARPRSLQRVYAGILRRK
jgi:hypothetical protein